MIGKSYWLHMQQDKPARIWKPMFNLIDCLNIEVAGNLNLTAKCETFAR